MTQVVQELNAKLDEAFAHIKTLHRASLHLINRSPDDLGSRDLLISGHRAANEAVERLMEEKAAVWLASTASADVKAVAA